MSERRYQDDEVKEIFRLATSRETADPRAVAAPDGLTLDEIQSIGGEVGLEPTAIASAATALDTRAMPTTPSRSLGMPVGVSRIVPLPRAATDDEWAMLVAELRETFGARGKVIAEGSLREWSNGMLHACIEPTESGYRLRIGTMKSGAAQLNTLGAIGLGLGTLACGGILMIGGPLPSMIGPAWMGAAGAGALLLNVLRLPPWAQKREQQMDHITTRIASIMRTNTLSGDTGSVT